MGELSGYQIALFSIICCFGLLFAILGTLLAIANSKMGKA